MALLPPEPDHAVSGRTWALAALAVLLSLGVAAVATMRHSSETSGEIRQEDPYALHLPISGIEMSEATNGTGGKSTYVDGVVTNTGDRVLTGAVVQVTFATSDGSAPHREILPLTLVRTKIPYVDLQPVSAAPIPPHGEREFRLIFESVPAQWDIKSPAILVIHADLE